MGNASLAQGGYLPVQDAGVVAAAGIAGGGGVFNCAGCRSSGRRWHCGGGGGIYLCRM